MSDKSIESSELNAVLPRLASIIESRRPDRGGDPQASYVARLLHRGPDAFLKKIGEEATEAVMAAKDLDLATLTATGVQASRQRLVGEMADLWFHCLVALAHYGLRPEDVLAELHQREGTSGMEEKALRKAVARDGQ